MSQALIELLLYLLNLFFNVIGIKTLIVLESNYILSKFIEFIRYNNRVIILIVTLIYTGHHS